MSIKISNIIKKILQDKISILLIICYIILIFFFIISSTILIQRTQLSHSYIYRDIHLEITNIGNFRNVTLSDIPEPIISSIPNVNIFQKLNGNKGLFLGLTDDFTFEDRHIHYNYLIGIAVEMLLIKLNLNFFDLVSSSTFKSVYNSLHLLDAYPQPYYDKQTVSVFETILRTYGFDSTFWYPFTSLEYEYIFATIRMRTSLISFLITLSSILIINRRLSKHTT